MGGRERERGREDSKEIETEREGDCLDLLLTDFPEMVEATV